MWPHPPHRQHLTGFFPLWKGPVEVVVGPPDFLSVFLGVVDPDVEFSAFVIFCADFTIVVSCSSQDSIEATLAAMGLTSLLGCPTAGSSVIKFPPLL